MILWGQPLWLLALLVPILLLLLELLLARRGRTELLRFASESLWNTLSPGRSVKLRRLQRWLFILALAFLSVGLANPRIGTRYEEVVREGIDIVLVVDVSKSMDSQDIRPSRLAKTRYELAHFIRGMKGDRIGIVPFAGDAYPLLPLTLDYSAARMFLDLLGTDLIPVSGTDIATAIRTALDVFPKEEDKVRDRAIVLVSDGEDHEGNVEAATQMAAKAGVRIFTVGMALAKGDPIPVFDDEGNHAGWMTDNEGNVITSRLNEQVLQDIASATGGDYRKATQGDMAFREIYKELFRLEKSEFESRRITGYEDRFQPLLIIALALLLLQSLLPLGTRKHKMKRAAVNSISAAVLLALLLSPAVVRAQTAHTLVKEGNNKIIDREYDGALEKYLEAKATRDSSRAELTYDLAGAYARKGETELADSLYRTLPEETREDLLSRAAYNRGTLLANGDNYEEAIQSLIEALRHNPEDMDAKRNLELVLQRQKQPPENQQQQQNQQNQQQQQQQQQQQNQDQQDQNQDKQDQEQNKDQQDQEEKEQPQSPEEEMNKQMAERLLDQLQQDEKELLKDVVRKQIPQSRKQTDKPW